MSQLQFIEEDSPSPSIQPMGCLFEQSLYIVFDLMVLILADKMKVSREDMEKRHRNVE